MATNKRHPTVKKRRTLSNKYVGQKKNESKLRQRMTELQESISTSRRSLVELRRVPVPVGAGGAELVEGIDPADYPQRPSGPTDDELVKQIQSDEQELAKVREALRIQREVNEKLLAEETTAAHEETRPEREQLVDAIAEKVEELQDAVDLYNEHFGELHRSGFLISYRAFPWAAGRRSNPQSKLVAWLELLRREGTI